MNNSRYIDLDIEGVHVKYLAEDGETVPTEVYERMRRNILSSMTCSCPKCHSTSVNYITDNVLQCNACSYEDLDTYFFD